jgi:hypothetical protein
MASTARPRAPDGRSDIEEEPSHGRDRDRNALHLPEVRRAAADQRPGGTAHLYGLSERGSKPARCDARAPGVLCKGAGDAGERRASWRRSGAAEPTRRTRAPERPGTAGATAGDVCWDWSPSGRWASGTTAAAARSELARCTRDLAGGGSTLAHGNAWRPGRRRGSARSRSRCNRRRDSGWGSANDGAGDRGRS